MIIIGVVTTPQDHFTKVWTEFWSHATGIHAFSLVYLIQRVNYVYSCAESSDLFLILSWMTSNFLYLSFAFLFFMENWGHHLNCFIK